MWHAFVGFLHKKCPPGHSTKRPRLTGGCDHSYYGLAQSSDRSCWAPGFLLGGLACASCSGDVFEMMGAAGRDAVAIYCKGCHDADPATRACSEANCPGCAAAKMAVEGGRSGRGKRQC